MRYEPEQALATLPKLLADHDDRERLVTLVRRLMADERVQHAKPSTEQLAMIDNIGVTLAVNGSAPIVRAKGRKRSRSKSATARS